MMEDNRKILVNEIYHHFKGNDYKVLFIANDCERTNDLGPIEVVVYEALYDDKKIWVRDYDSFNSVVDIIKYPNVLQKYRFELVKK